MRSGRLSERLEPSEPIVGLVKDLQWLSALEAPERIAYLNYWQQDRSNSWSQDSRTHIRVSGAAAAAMVPEIRRMITEIDPDVPVSDVQVLGRQLDVKSLLLTSLFGDADDQRPAVHR